MSRIYWHKVILPEDSQPVETLEDVVYGGVIENVRRYSVETSDLQIPDPKAIRSMTRAAAFLSSMIFDLEGVLGESIKEDPFSVGIYCALENGPIDGPSTVEIMNRTEGGLPDRKFAEAYRKLRNPKMYLKQLPNLAAAQFGISLGIQGPMNVYTHSEFASIQALEQAREDLLHQRIKVAVVMAAHSFDDLWVVRRSRVQDLRVLCEGAGLVVANQVADLDRLLEYKLKDSKYFYGIADLMVNVLR